MSITDDELATLTDRHRLVIRDYHGDGTHESGLYYTGIGLCMTADGYLVRHENGALTSLADRIVQIIAPPFDPVPGMVVGLPGCHPEGDCVAIRGCQNEDPWLADKALVSHLDLRRSWQNDTEIADLIARGRLAVLADPRETDR